MSTIARANRHVPVTEVFRKGVFAEYPAYVAKPTVSAKIGHQETQSDFLPSPSSKTWPYTIDPIAAAQSP